MSYKEYYHQAKDDAAMYREQRHSGKTQKSCPSVDKELTRADHCVEYLREYIMCKPDLSLVTFHWIDHTAQHENPAGQFPTNRDRGLHECANWNALDAWAGNHVFNLYAVDLLKKPATGSQDD